MADEHPRIDEIQAAQDRLADALARARAGEDRELARQVRDRGEQFARLLYGILRMTRIHALDNAAFHEPVQEFSRSLAALWDLLGTVHLICVEDQVYVNDVRIRFDFAAEQVSTLGQDLRRHQVGGISFNEALPPDRVREFLRRITEPPARQGARRALQEKLNESGLSSIELQGVFRFRVKGEIRKKADRGYREIYVHSAAVIAEAYGNLAASRLPNPLPVRRLVTELIDGTRNADASDLAQDADEHLPPLARHCLMVTSLSLLIGRGAGFSDATLGDLGVAAMFHDVGLFLKEDGFPVPYERHASAGLRSLMRQRGFHEAKIRRLLATVEHHRPHDDERGPPSLFARVIHIADDFDILTRYRPGAGPILAHPDALARMASRAGQAYDPVLLGIFINEMGMFPPGSILRLASGAIVVSVSGVRSPDTFARPLCRVVRRADGTRPEAGEAVDLAQGDRVLKVLRPSA